MRPRLLLLDVNETLSDTAPMADAFARAGTAPEHADTWFASVLRDGFALAAAGTAAPFVELARHHLARFAGADRVDELLEVFLSLDVHADVRTGLPRLAGAGLRVATLSNGSASVAEGLLERAGLAEHVEACLSVEDPGAWKPHPRSYRWAVERLGVDPAEAALVAVHPWDTDGAVRAGLAAVLVDRAGDRYPPYLLGPTWTVSAFDEIVDVLV